MNNSIKTILLDLGGVVFNSSGVSNNQIKWSVINELNHQYGHALNIGQPVFDLFMAAYNEKTDLSISGSDFLSLVFDTLKFNQSLIDMLSHYPIIIVSDNYRENINYISKRFHFSKWALDQYYSFDLELEKSDPTFFPKLLELLQNPAKEFIFIDDSIKKIRNAREVGISAVQYLDNDSLRSELEKNGLILN
jgi:FMN phosphatase YigB (HAD superfamily)